MINAASNLPAATAPTGHSFDEVVKNLREESTIQRPVAASAGVPTGAVGSSASMTPPLSPTSKKPNKNRTTYIIAAIILLLLLIGGAVAFFLFNKNTELRQQASTGNAGPGCGSVCATDLDCPSNFQCMSGKCNAASCTLAQQVPGGSSVVSSAACLTSFDVAAPTITCSKTAYRDELSNSAGNYTLTQAQSGFLPGDNIVFALSSGSSDKNATVTLVDKLDAHLQFVDSNCGTTAYDSTTNTVTCPGVTATTSRAIRVKVLANTPSGTTITNTVNANANGCTPAPACLSANPPCKIVQPANTCQAGQTTTCSVPVTVGSITTPTPTPTPTATPTPTPTPSPTPTPTYTCGGSCTSDSQCQSVNAGWVCASNYGNTCRLDSNRGSTSCTPLTYSCNSGCTTDAQCQTVNAAYVCSSGACRLNSNTSATNCQPPVTPTPTPQVGCNQKCSTNSDCASSNYICADTSEGRVCRLDNYVNSDTCTTPPVTYVYTATPVPTSKPVVAPKLPVAGATDNTFKFILGGAGILLLGAIGLTVL